MVASSESTSVEHDQPEWTEFLARMEPGCGARPEDCDVWRGLDDIQPDESEDPDEAGPRGLHAVAVPMQPAAASSHLPANPVSGGNANVSSDAHDRCVRCCVATVCSVLCCFLVVFSMLGSYVISHSGLNHTEFCSGHVCNDSCEYAGDGTCDEPSTVDEFLDEGPCDFGTDLTDCGADHSISSTGCRNSCRHANDGTCDEPQLCDAGTDYSDCFGAGSTGIPGVKCCNSCRHTNDGTCDEPSLCAAGTDCTDCREHPALEPEPEPEPEPKTEICFVSTTDEIWTDLMWLCLSGLIGGCAWLFKKDTQDVNRWGIYYLVDRPWFQSRRSLFLRFQLLSLLMWVQYTYFNLCHISTPLFISGMFVTIMGIPMVQCYHRIRYLDTSDFEAGLENHFERWFADEHSPQLIQAIVKQGFTKIGQLRGLNLDEIQTLSNRAKFTDQQTIAAIHLVLLALGNEHASAGPLGRAALQAHEAKALQHHH